MFGGHALVANPAAVPLAQPSAMTREKYVWSADSKMSMVCSMNAALCPVPIVPARIADIIIVLCQTLTMRLRTATVTHAQLTYVVGRLLGIRTRFRRLVARVRAGQTPWERARAPREAAPAPEFPLGFRPPPPGRRRWAMPSDKPVQLWRSLRQNIFAWVLPLAPNVPEFRDSAAGLRTRLLGLLAELETQALLLASRRVGDSPRPPCWMLGIEVSVLYPARPAVLTPDPSVPARENTADTPAPIADIRMPDPHVREPVGFTEAGQPFD